MGDGMGIQSGASTAERDLCFTLELRAEIALVLDDRVSFFGRHVRVCEQALAGCQLSL